MAPIQIGAIWVHAFLRYCRFRAPQGGPSAAKGDPRRPKGCRPSELLSEMRADGIQPDVVTYNAAISACEKCRNWDRVPGLLSGMRVDGIKPDVITYSAAISACEKCRMWDRVPELMSEMRAAGIKPDVVTYGAAISACEKCRDWDRVAELLSDKLGHGPRRYSHGPAVRRLRPMLKFRV